MICSCHVLQQHICFYMNLSDRLSHIQLMSVILLCALFFSAMIWSEPISTFRIYPYERLHYFALYNITLYGRLRQRPILNGHIWTYMFLSFSTRYIPLSSLTVLPFLIRSGMSSYNIITVYFLLAVLSLSCITISHICLSSKSIYYNAWHCKAFSCIRRQYHSSSYTNTYDFLPWYVLCLYILCPCIITFYLYYEYYLMYQHLWQRIILQLPILSYLIWHYQRKSDSKYSYNVTSVFL